MYILQGRYRDMQHMRARIYRVGGSNMNRDIAYDICRARTCRQFYIEHRRSEFITDTLDLVAYE